MFSRLQKTALFRAFPALAAVLAPALALAAEGVPLKVPTDPNAKYTVLEVRDAGIGRAEIITRREGASGILYARRMIDCETDTFEYMGEGATLEEMYQSPPAGVVGETVPGTVAFTIADYACESIGR